MPMEPTPTRSSARPAINDRLGSTLFLAVLLHGVVILGVTFSVATFDDDHAPPTLNVTLLVDSRDEPKPDKADFIANRNSQLPATRRRVCTRPTLCRTQEPSLRWQPRRRGSHGRHPARARAEREELVSRGQSESVNATPQPTGPTRRTYAGKRPALVDALAPQTTATELGLRAELPEWRRRAPHVDRNPERAAIIASPNISRDGGRGSSESARRTIRRAFSAAPTTRQADAGGHHSGGRVAEGHRRAPLVGRQGARPGRPQDSAARGTVRPASRRTSAKDYDVLRFAYDWDFFDSARKSSAQTQPEDRN